MAALTAVTASTTPLTPEASSTASCIADRLSSTSSASWSSDSLACSPASVSGVPSPLHVVDELARRALEVVDGVLHGASLRFPSLSEAAVDEIDSLQDVIAEQTSSGPLGGRAVASIAAAAAAGQEGGQQRDDEPS